MPNFYKMAISILNITKLNKQKTLLTFWGQLSVKISAPIITRD